MRIPYRPTEAICSGKVTIWIKRGRSTRDGKSTVRWSWSYVINRRSAIFWKARECTVDSPVMVILFSQWHGLKRIVTYYGFHFSWIGRQGLAGKEQELKLCILVTLWRSHIPINATKNISLQIINESKARNSSTTAITTPLRRVTKHIWK